VSAELPGSASALSVLPDRFLHLCYCCADADAAVRFLTDGLGLVERMRTTTERSSGAIFGMEEDIESTAVFVYDQRGPRSSTAIEVQEWLDPPVEGAPFSEPNHVGIQALGFAVPDVDDAVGRLERAGATLLGRSSSSVFGGPAAVLRDPNRITIDVVEGPDADTRLRHLRITCSDAARSLDWYTRFGFEVVSEADSTDGELFGMHAPVGLHATRLRLGADTFELVILAWDEPEAVGRHYEEAYHAGIYRAALRVEDTRRSHEQLSAQGWGFDRPPLLIELSGTPVPDMWITFSSDPDGIPYELVQRPASSFRPPKPAGPPPTA
jgi:catechol 2,3-dioxygenase-like lactoylglutathione lyase family enzyme